MEDDVHAHDIHRVVLVGALDERSRRDYDRPHRTYEYRLRSVGVLLPMAVWDCSAVALDYWAGRSRHSQDRYYARSGTGTVQRIKTNDR
jgi:hypothetical protein